jgi:hypothetical protein
MSERKSEEIRMLRTAIGNDAFAGHANAVQIAKAMFANSGIDVSKVEVFRCRVRRNHDFDDVQGGTVIPTWDLYAEVEYLADAEDPPESQD